MTNGPGSPETGSTPEQGSGHFFEQDLQNHKRVVDLIIERERSQLLLEPPSDAVPSHVVEKAKTDWAAISPYDPFFSFFKALPARGYEAFLCKQDDPNKANIYVNPNHADKVDKLYSTFERHPLHQLNLLVEQGSYSGVDVGDLEKDEGLSRSLGQDVATSELIQRVYLVSQINTQLPSGDEYGRSQGRARSDEDRNEYERLRALGVKPLGPEEFSGMVGRAIDDILKTRSELRP